MTVSSAHGFSVASSAIPPHRSTTFSPRWYAANAAPTSNPSAKFFSKRSRTPSKPGAVQPSIVMPDFLSIGAAESTSACGARLRPRRRVGEPREEERELTFPELLAPRAPLVGAVHLLVVQGTRAGCGRRGAPRRTRGWPPGTPDRPLGWRTARRVGVRAPRCDVQDHVGVVEAGRRDQLDGWPGSTRRRRVRGRGTRARRGSTTCHRQPRRDPGASRRTASRRTRRWRRPSPRGRARGVGAEVAVDIRDHRSVTYRSLWMRPPMLSYHCPFVPSGITTIAAMFGSWAMSPSMISRRCPIATPSPASPPPPWSR